MKYLAIISLTFGIIGFISYLFMIMASALSCCAGVTTNTFYHVVIGILILAVITFATCMFNSCCKVKKT